MERANLFEQRINLVVVFLYIALSPKITLDIILAILIKVLQ